jgi:hypothetical protein
MTTSKVGDKVRWLDKMAAPVSLTLNGDFTHSTLLGGFFTVFAYLGVVAWYWYETVSSLSASPSATLQVKPSNSPFQTSPYDSIAQSQICLVAGWLPSANGVLQNNDWNLTIYF